MKLYRLIPLAIALAALAVFAKADTVSQTLTIDQIDVLAGGSSPIDVQRFDPALGTLTDVRITYEGFVWHTRFRLKNTTNQMIVNFSTGAWCIPYLDDERGSWFPTLSITQSMIPASPCGPVFPIFFPGGVHWFEATRDTSVPYYCHGTWIAYTPITMSLLSHASPGLEYWTGTQALHFNVRPTFGYSVHLLFPWMPWPGELAVFAADWSGTVTITYEYTPC